MKHELSAFVDENYRQGFEAGRLQEGYAAALFCVANGVPIPDWLAPTVKSALQRDFISSEGRGRGHSAPIAESRKSEFSSFILAEVDRLKSLGRTKVRAFEEIAQDLRNHDQKHWTADMVKTEYYRAR